MRFCLKYNKKICWHCCNENRVHKNCSELCDYSIKSSETTFSSKTRVDSTIEWLDLLKRQFDLWIDLPEKKFGNKTPREMSNSDTFKQELDEYFHELEKYSFLPLNSFRKKLNLGEKKYNDEIYPELISDYFLESVIVQEWERTTGFFSKNRYKDDKFKENLKKRLSESKLLKSVKSYSIISSGVNENRDISFVFYEINGKKDLSVFLSRENYEWVIISIIAGIPELYNSSAAVFHETGRIISQGEFGKAWDKLKKYSEIYLNSSDLYYYWGMYYLLQNKVDKAQPYFFNSYEIDSSFIESYYYYGLCCQLIKNNTEAENIYREIMNIRSDDEKIMNNLAAILIDKGDIAEARKILKDALEVNPTFEPALKNMERINGLQS